MTVRLTVAQALLQAQQTSLGADVSRTCTVKELQAALDSTQQARTAYATAKRDQRMYL
jgi:hypothetical protein